MTGDVSFSAFPSAKGVQYFLFKRSICSSLQPDIFLMKELVTVAYRHVAYPVTASLST